MGNFGGVQSIKFIYKHKLPLLPLGAGGQN
jgi:hypothetical protein